MQILGHRVTGGEAEVGVLSQYLDGELHLVDDSLSGSVAAGEQLKIFGPIIGSQTIDVVNRLFSQQFSTDLLLHDVSMLEHVSGGLSADARNHDPDVAPSALVSRDFLVGMFFPVGKTTKERSAFGTAQRFESIDGAAGSSLDGHGFPALDAVDGPSVIRKPTTDTPALRGTVHRVFVELFSVFAEICGFVKERFTADSALKFSNFGLRGRATVRRFVRSFARSSAEALMCMRRLDLKKGRALFTGFFNRHFVSSLVVTTTFGSTDVYASKQETI
jgi:hypothetical protein